MVRVNGQQSEAVVMNVAIEVKGGLGELFLVLEAPLSDSHLWTCGTRVTIEATWSHNYILYPTQKDLAVILDQCSIKGPFLVDEVNAGECLEVTLESAGALTPLDPPLDSTLSSIRAVNQVFR